MEQQTIANIEDPSVAEQNNNINEYEEIDEQTLQNNAVKQANYQKLKKKYKALKQEYIKVLQSWEDTNKKVKNLSKERAFLRTKLEAFLKTQIP